jgi:hypothetical protein
MPEIKPTATFILFPSTSEIDRNSNEIFKKPTREELLQKRKQGQGEGNVRRENVSIKNIVGDNLSASGDKGVSNTVDDTNKGFVRDQINVSRESSNGDSINIIQVNNDRVMPDNSDDLDDDSIDGGAQKEVEGKEGHNRVRGGMEEGGPGEVDVLRDSLIPMTKLQVRLTYIFIYIYISCR